MASRSRRRPPAHGKGTPPRQEVARTASETTGLRPRLQILAGFLLPLVVLGLWLNSRGFWSP